MTMRTKERVAGVLVLLLLLSLAAWPLLGQGGGGYDVNWYAVEGGGVTFAGGGAYTLGGTMGQAEAGAAGGGAYALNSGFWGEAAPTAVPPDTYAAYLPAVLK